MKKVLGILDCHNSCNLGELTADRPLASVSFLGRYAFMDFPLSNFCNSGIDNVGILVKDHQRSILKHMGNMMSWVNNTKSGRINIFYNEKGQMNPRYNTDLNNIKENDWVILKSDAEYIVFQSADVITNMDLSPLLEEHIERGDELTVVYKEVHDADEAFIGCNTYEIDSDSYVISTTPNDGSKKVAKVALGTWIVNRNTLHRIIEEAEKVDASWGMKEMIGYIAEKGIVDIHAIPYTGYVRRMDSLEHYVKYSFELLNPDVAKMLFPLERPIYTQTYDTPPAIYGETGGAKNSFVSNGAIIEGRVENSIVCREVTIGKGTVIKNSIILAETKIGEGVTLDNVVIDKYSRVNDHHEIKGDKDHPIYLKQGARI
ncbi:MAG: glucose-1-phosphate adenylyltransferase subunit GlgD [Bacilli bacterium]|nr:glucose-1-phosphate adenylyltransferase subunit GlgD [Bacilli bacterium]